MDPRALFLDTSGIFALLVSNDSHHKAAKACLKRAQELRQRLVTTDYILDEAATLLVARNVPRQAPILFNLVRTSEYLMVEWMNAERFAATEKFFSAHLDQGYSFTDCVSFETMRELRIKQVLTADTHFREAGFEILLAAKGAK